MQVGREHQFQRMAHAVGHPEWLEDERFATREGWRDHLDAVIRPAIEKWASDKTKLEAATLLAEQGIVAGPSYDADDLLRDPHVQSHEMILSVERPDGGEPLHVVGNPVKLSRSQPRSTERWPLLAQHTDEILEQDLGMVAAEREALRAAGVIA
jgi:crotonobetainyl-CoA:carnitine CoA-transferase CaiB-like acyl-CoA transferase